MDIAVVTEFKHSENRVCNESPDFPVFLVSFLLFHFFLLFLLKFWIYSKKFAMIERSGFYG